MLTDPDIEETIDKMIAAGSNPDTLIIPKKLYDRYITDELYLQCKKAGYTLYSSNYISEDEIFILDSSITKFKYDEDFND